MSWGSTRRHITRSLASLTYLSRQFSRTEHPGSSTSSLVYPKSPPDKAKTRHRPLVMEKSQKGTPPSPPGHEEVAEGHSVPPSAANTQVMAREQDNDATFTRVLPGVNSMLGHIN